MPCSTDRSAGVEVLHVVVRKRTEEHLLLLLVAGVVRGTKARIAAASAVLVFVITTVTLAGGYGRVNENLREPN